jgi:hypothetical protein
MTAKFWIGGTGTWDNTGDTHWSLSSGGANNTTHPVTGDTATFDASSGGGTVTVNANLIFDALILGAFTGTLDFSANNNNVTFTGTANPALSVTGTGTRTFNMGNGTWSFPQATGAALVDFSTSTNLTFNANSSNISFTSSAPSAVRVFNGGGLTFATITVAAANAQPFALLGSNTIGTLNLTAPLYVQFPNGSTTTITNPVTWSGTSTTQFFLNTNSGGSAAATINTAVGSTISFAAMRLLTSAGTAPTLTNCFDLKNNTGFTFPAVGGGGGGGHIIGG